MISRALSALGLMKRSDHEAVKLQAAADEQKIGRLQSHLDVADRTIGKLYIERDDWKAKHASSVGKLGASEAKFKLAATDLAKQAELVSDYEAALGFSFNGECPICGGIEGCSHSRAERVGAAISRAASHEYDALESEIASLRPDALKWRDYLKRSRDRKAARKGSVS